MNTEVEFPENMEGFDVGFSSLHIIHGKDGLSPAATAEETDDGVKITITDVNGTTAAIVKNGKQGEQGIKGVQGEKGETGSAGEAGPAGPQGPIGETGPIGPQGPAGEKGEDGKDGKSAYEIALDNGFKGTETEWLVSLKGADGQNGVDGKDGKDGKDGVNGVDGSSVTVTSVLESTVDGGSNVVTFSDGKSITIKNGSKGSAGATGATGNDGADGYTPQRGVDYWTDEDKTEIKSYVDEAILGGVW